MWTAPNTLHLHFLVAKTQHLHLEGDEMRKGSKTVKMGPHLIVPENSHLHVTTKNAERETIICKNKAGNMRENWKLFNTFSLHQKGRKSREQLLSIPLTITLFHKALTWLGLRGEKNHATAAHVACSLLVAPGCLSAAPHSWPAFLPFLSAAQDVQEFLPPRLPDEPDPLTDFITLACPHIRIWAKDHRSRDKALLSYPWKQSRLVGDMGQVSGSSGSSLGRQDEGEAEEVWVCCCMQKG